MVLVTPEVGRAGCGVPAVGVSDDEHPGRKAATANTVPPMIRPRRASSTSNSDLRLVMSASMEGMRMNRVGPGQRRDAGRCRQAALGLALSDCRGHRASM